MLSTKPFPKKLGRIEALVSGDGISARPDSDDSISCFNGLRCGVWHTASVTYIAAVECWKPGEHNLQNIICQETAAYVL